MKKTSIRFAALLITAVTLSSCEKDGDPAPVDSLEQLGLLGLWKPVSREVNDSIELATECCDYINFTPDANLSDLNGNFESAVSGNIIEGTFTINATTDSMSLNFDEQQRLYGLQIADTTMVVTYVLNNDTVVETLRKEE